MRVPIEGEDMEAILDLAKHGFKKSMEMVDRNLNLGTDNYPVSGFTANGISSGRGGRKIEVAVRVEVVRTYDEVKDKQGEEDLGQLLSRASELRAEAEELEDEYDRRRPRKSLEDMDERERLFFQWADIIEPRETPFLDRLRSNP